MSILETIFQGCTVIEYHVPGPDYIIKHGESGSLVKNIDQMSEIIQKGERVLVEIACKRGRDSFLWNNTASKMSEWICNNI